MMPHPLIGLRTRYVGTTHRALHGYTVVVVAVLRQVHGSDGAYLRTQEALDAAGGLQRGDRLEVCPVLADGRVSFVASDVAPEELSAFHQTNGEDK